MISPDYILSRGAWFRSGFSDHAILESKSSEENSLIIFENLSKRFEKCNVARFEHCYLNKELSLERQ
ncbi:hypothetical protein CDAR_590041 [Caerostris darwini]|uniref:Uncharacterized protein n=1 Tax=Caerostris darwini TaxID=1538125 RepID=A0AAV4RJ59_9ARAC|nr:hypothetical protein CDAR_590041 [Caerostris darwini]